MAADSVHQSIERELKKCEDVRDFQEYVDTLERARCKVISMEAINIKCWKDHSNRATINKGGPKLSRTWQLSSSEEEHNCSSTGRFMEAIALSLSLIS
ncbi:hypothetical protein RRG08_048879 [Elysia crispata]|uniref:Uncharacterized protein n=1 Tax=Elysia crispata TaxID=231223 RepID=A0AAE0YTA9_9GAST|nr:hypothetical protein RRG08_048879 [Elysia crispata]